MKRFYTFLFLIACGSIGFAQQFSVSPGPVANIDVVEGGSGEHTIYFRNETSQPLLLVWERSGNTFDPNWSISICDNNLCYFSAHPGDTMASITGGQNAFLKLTCGVALGQAGAGALKYKVYVSGDTSTTVEVTFNVNGTVSIDASSFANQVRISPNPVSSMLTMRSTTGVLEKGEAQVYDLTGKLLREISVKGVDAMDIDVQTLPEGAYLLRYITNEGVVTRRFIKTN